MLVRSVQQMVFDTAQQGPAAIQPTLELTKRTCVLTDRLHTVSHCLHTMHTNEDCISGICGICGTDCDDMGQCDTCDGTCCNSHLCLQAGCQCVMDEIVERTLRAA